MNDKELILKLKLQHLSIQKDLSSILEELNLNNENEVNSIILNLNKFKTDLLNHLKLEDEQFYPAYFKKSQCNKESAQNLIVEMSKIVEVVQLFLKKYENVIDIINNENNFKNELLEIINTLNVRIETEEEDIYSLYLV